MKNNCVNRPEGKNLNFEITITLKIDDKIRIQRTIIKLII